MARKIIQGTSLVTDTYIQDTAADTNYGSNTDLYVGEGNWDAVVIRSLVKFDVTSIPTNATVTSAALYLKILNDYSNNARTFRCYRVLRNWVEAQATWNSYSTGNAWGTAGCSNTTTDREATDIGTCAFTASESVGTWKSFTLTASKVEDWVDGGLTNYGVLIQADTETDDNYRFNSSEAATSTNGPYLDVYYTYPGERGQSLIMSGGVIV